MRIAVAALILALAGCAGAPQLSVTTMDWDAQRAELVKLAPLGTPRDEVGQALQQAGIEFSPSGETGDWKPGMNSSLFYCDRWTSKGGPARLLNAELLFDADGRLYQIRPSQTRTEVVEELSPGLR